MGTLRFAAHPVLTTDYLGCGIHPALVCEEAGQTD